MRYLYNMEIDREISELGHRLNDIEAKIDYLRDCTEAELAKCEENINDRITYNTHYRHYGQQHLFTTENGFSWEWKPAKKEFRDYKLNKIYNFFINYDENDDGIRIKWIPLVERIKAICVEPGNVYFNHHEAIQGSHCRNIYIDRPALIKNIFVKTDQVVNQNDDVYSVKYIDINPKLEEILNASKLKCLPYDKFIKLNKFFNWCKETNRYAILAAKVICDYPRMLTPTVQFEELYKDAIDGYKTYDPRCFINENSRTQKSRSHLRQGVTVRMQVYKNLHFFYIISYEN